MKIIQLITFRNSVLRDHLMDAGYSLVEFIQPLSESDNKELGKGNFKDYKIIEIIDDNDENTRELLDTVCNSGKIICIVHTITESLKGILLERAISNVIQADDVNRLVSYLQVIDNDQPSDSRKMLILEKNIPVKKILKTLLNRFGYKPIFHDSIENLFNDLKKKDIQYILINIGLDNLDINSMVKKSLSRVEMRKYPVIAYKDMQKGIFVHEVATGLNRLTKVILNIEEVYSFLLNILFAKEIIPLAGIIFKSLDYKNLENYISDNLSQIYYKNQENIFSSHKIINDDNIEGMLHCTELFRKTIIKTDGLKWLKVDNAEKEANICGFHGEILHHP